MRLAGKVAIITGSAMGIGAATARLFAAEGARVVVADLADEDGKRVAAEIGQAGGQVLYVHADVSSPEEVDSLIRETLAAFGRVDVLFNNAGVVVPKPLLETTEEEYETVLRVNLKGAFLCCKSVLPVMIAQGGGSVINNSSNAAIVGRPGMPVYGASKAALLALTRSAAVAYGPQNVRFNAILPGTIWTSMTRDAFSRWGDLDEQKRATVRVTPLRRVGDPEDVAYLALFLASDESRFITGAAIPVDGGRTAGIAEAFGPEG